MPYINWPLSSSAIPCPDRTNLPLIEGSMPCPCLYLTGKRVFPQEPLNDRLLSVVEDSPRLQTVVCSPDDSVNGVYVCTYSADEEVL